MDGLNSASDGDSVDWTNVCGRAASRVESGSGVKGDEEGQSGYTSAIRKVLTQQNMVELLLPVDEALRFLKRNSCSE